MQRTHPGFRVVLALSAIVFLLAAGMGRAFSEFDPLSMINPRGLGMMLPAWVLPPLIWFAYLAIAITRRRIDRPFSVMRIVTYMNRSWLLRGATFTAIMFPMGRAFSAYKGAIPAIVPFYADPYLAAADEFLFGVDPWQLSHAVFGPLATVVIDRIYSLWFLVMMLLMGWLNFTRNQSLQIRGLLTYLLTWFVLGNFIATALSSVGPCFYEQFYGSTRYSALMQNLKQVDADHKLMALGSMRFLLSSIGTDRFGSGISAMPSLHVSIAYLCFLVTLAGTKQIWLKALAGLFALAILVGSVHLGWHYAVDGLFAILVVTLIWIGTGKFVDWLERRAAATAGSSTIVAEEGVLSPA